MDIVKYEISSDKLRWHCDPSVFDFECTKDLAPLHQFIGQERAIRAIEFGLAMEHDGYNIYVAGLRGETVPTPRIASTTELTNS